MLSILRQTAGQSRLSCRRLTTATLSTPLEQPNIISYAEIKAGGVTGPLQAVPLVEPLYLAMSCLVRPTKNEDPSEKVVALDPFVFKHPIRRDILHLCVIHHRDSLRQGSANTKTRGEVRGSGRKIRPQKGSGKARLGDGQSPMLTGGGVAFGPKPRDFSTTLPRKVIEMGKRVGLSAKLRDRSMGIVENFNWSGTKTKDLAARIQELSWRGTLFVTGLDQIPVGLERSIGNLEKVEITTAADLNVYQLVKWPRIVMDVAAVDWFERTLGKKRVSPSRLQQ
ncbi:hypothetical protein JAAARDRAFT_169294 [Jaapia argillacea MUCL 33604]|uniref:Large ribosomal subunit protein uL4m n=1 Tax=Jaapia argillacea MUCL 33604 TaxID=933084 RepID=A0A067QIZ2_9AGAM|nr:hypothetical protein JAAARDRAFT_169294 [Jaapia argillacea MUCL 33604]